MKFRNAVRPELVFLDLAASGPDDALAAIADRLESVDGLDSAAVLQALAARERLGSTSIGNGFAIPHCKLAELDNVLVAMARTEAAIDFAAGRNHPPVRFFFVVLSPPDQPAEHLQVLSQIARLLKHDDLRQQLLEAQDPSSVVAAIERTAEAEGL